MISIKPDPAHPQGGYAELALPAESIECDSVEISVFDIYSERYLGETGWQAAKLKFGPYVVARNGDQARVVIGPEIVNQIEEYANLRLSVGQTSHDLNWPDEIVPAPGAARLGGIAATPTEQKKSARNLTAQMPLADDERSPAAQVPATPDPAPIVEMDAPPRQGRISMQAAIIVLLAIFGAAAIIYWIMLQSDTSADVTLDQVPPNPCAAQALRALDGFADQVNEIRRCGPEVSAEAALALLEHASADGNAQALILFGTLYDGVVTDDVFENVIGLTFQDDPATAADYYARARAAGSDEASVRLSALCERMSGMTETLVRGAVADHCGS